MIEVRDLRFGYAAADQIFRGFSWTAGRGETWSLLGPSGCGKTTLLHLLAGLRRPRGGLVAVAGQPVAGVRRSTGLVLQDHGLLPWATAAENVALGLRIRGVAPAARAELVGRWLTALDIDDVRCHYPAQLSGGQRQRVAIARCLALEPDLLLMDEPFGSLDALTREDLQDLLLGLTTASSDPPTVVLVTHDVAEAVLLGQKVMVLPRAPIDAGIVLDNAHDARPEYRRQAEFHARCLAVREAVASARGRGDSGARQPAAGERRVEQPSPRAAGAPPSPSGGGRA